MIFNNSQSDTYNPVLSTIPPTHNLRYNTLLEIKTVKILINRDRYSYINQIDHPLNSYLVNPDLYVNLTLY